MLRDDTTESLPPVDQVFKPGSNVMIEFIDERGFMKSFSSIIDDISSEGMALFAPVDQGALVKINPGQELGIYRPEGQKAYVCQVRVLEYKLGSPPLVLTTVPLHVECQPRRRFFRVDVEIPYQSANHSGMIVNASGNGLLLSSSKDCFRAGAQFDIQFKLPTMTQTIGARVKVTREFKRGNHYLAGVLLVGLRPQLQDEIIKYLLARQRELVKLGLLFPDNQVFI